MGFLQNILDNSVLDWFFAKAANLLNAEDKILEIQIKTAYQKGQYQEMIEKISELLKKYPFSDDLILLKAYALVSAGEMKKAREELAVIIQNQKGETIAKGSALVVETLSWMGEAITVLEKDVNDTKTARDVLKQAKAKIADGIHSIQRAPRPQTNEKEFWMKVAKQIQKAIKELL